MAYNVFKRPMFKRGGSTTGTGIMSHVEPRVKAAGGYFPMPAKGTPLDPRTLSQTELGDIARKRFLNNLKTYGSKGLDILKKAGQRTAGFVGANRIPMTGPIGKMAAPFAGVGALMYLNRPKTDVALEVMKSEPSSTFDETNIDDFNDYTERLMKANKQGNKISFMDVFKKPKDSVEDFEVSGGIAEVKPGESAMDAVFNRAQEQIEDAANKAANKPDSGKEPKYEEADLRTKVQKEADEIMDMLKDEDLNKAEAALLVSKALKTPGSISDKIDVAVTDAMGIARRKSKEDKQAKLLAYEAVKEKEIAEAKRGELPAVGKIVQRLSDLKATDPNLLSASEKNEMKYLEDQLAKESYQDKQVLSFMSSVLAANRDQIPSLERKIKELQSQEKLDDEEKSQLEKYIKEYSTLKFYEEQLGVGIGLKDGGRVEYAEGSENPNAPTVESDETKGGSNIFPTKTVEKLSFGELRQKLPKEITNDIVQLIANSEEALQDFAYIKTQTDINDFNLKYGVNLVLPPQQG
jgi:hypothetical protein